KAFREAVRAAARAVSESGASDAVLYFTELTVKGHDQAWNAMQLAVLAADASYRFEQLKSKRDQQHRVKIQIGVTDKPSAEVARAVQHGAALAEGSNLAKDLGNLPSNICTPSYLARQAQELA